MPDTRNSSPTPASRAAQPLDYQSPFDLLGETPVPKSSDPHESEISYIALSLGVCSPLALCCGPVVGLAGLITGIIALSTSRKGKGLAITGILLSLMGIALGFIEIIGFL